MASLVEPAVHRAARPRGGLRGAGLCLAATVLSGALLYLGSGLHPVAALTWIAPLPLLLLAPRVRAAPAALAAAAAWVAGQSGLWWYLHHSLEMPLALEVGALTLYPLLSVGGVLLFRALVRRGRYVPAAAAPPVVWVAGEYLISVSLPHGAWLSLGYTQADVPVVLQVASATGVWGVSFLLLGAASAVAALAAPAVTGRARLRVAAAAVVTVALAGGYGVERLAAPDAPGRVRVGLLVADEPRDSVRPDTAAGRGLLRRYLAGIDRLADRGARIVVLPEKAFVATTATWPTVARPVAALAARRRVDVVVGTVLKRQGTAVNAAVAFPGDGGTPVTYGKHHLIPGLEDDLDPGTGLRFVPDRRGTGLIVCKDLDFPDLPRRYRAAGAGLLLAPAWDMAGDPWLHSRIAVTRGVEDGVGIARTARDGRLVVSDRTGVVAEADGQRHPSTALVADVTTGATRTVYARFGDWFAWLNLAAVLALLLVAVPRAGRRPGRSGPRIGPRSFRRCASRRAPAASPYEVSGGAGRRRRGG